MWRWIYIREEFLGCMVGIVKSAISSKGFIKRIGMAKAVFTKLRSVLSNPSICISTRVRILIRYVRSKQDP